jgi:hypothetical protein
MPLGDGEPLYLYVAATTRVVSAVIVVERAEEDHALLVPRPVYYISEVLLRTMCGSRTGGWPLPCVMSD